MVQRDKSLAEEKNNVLFEIRERKKNEMSEIVHKMNRKSAFFIDAISIHI